MKKADITVIDKYLCEFLDAACKPKQTRTTYVPASLTLSKTASLVYRKRRQKPTEWRAFLRNLLEGSEELRESVKALLDADKRIKAELGICCTSRDQITKVKRGGVS